MRSFRLFAVFALVGAAFSVACAQRFRMMGGDGGGSPGGIMYGFDMQSRQPTLRNDVSKELKLTDAQKTKLLEFQQKQMEEMFAAFQGGGGPPTQEQIQASMKKRNEAEAKLLKEVLDEAQNKRLKELWVQRAGNSIILNADIQKELGLSEDQNKKAKDLQAKQVEANQSIIQRARDGEIEFSEVRTLIEKNAKALNEELGKLLTKEQAEKLKAMGGAPFKFDADNIGG